MSSDSDDDCYGKIAQKLLSMKSNYKEDKIKTKNVLENGCNSASKSKKHTKESELPAIDLTEQQKIDLDDSTEINLDSIIEQNSKKCKTKGRPKKSDDVYVPDERIGRLRPRSSRRTKNVDRERFTKHLAEVVAQARASMPASSLSPRRARGSTPARRRGGRGRDRGPGQGRGRTGNMRRHIQNCFLHFNIGNTEEYEDLSEQQDLFSSKPTEVVIDDSLNDADNPADDSLDDNEELSVKVYWQSCEVFKFSIRRYQKFTEMFNYFMSKENVGREKLLFTYNDKMLSVDDTPDTINYNIVKFIDGGIVNQSLSPLKKKAKHQVVNGIKLKFQCQNVKKPFETVIEDDDKLSIAFMKCAEHLEKPLEMLKFYFDGDLISGKNTAKDLELEGGECIDVVINS